MTSVPVAPAHLYTHGSSAALPDMTGCTILQVIPELSAGGAERTVLEVTEAITAAGGTSLVASRGGRMEDDLARLGGELIVMDAKSKNPLVLRANARRLAEICLERGVDILHARSRAPAWSAFWAARRTATPFVTTYHGAYSARWAPKRAYNSVMARGDRVIANSKWTAAHILAEHGVAEARLVTIPRGVDLMSFDPATIPGPRVEAVRESWDISPAPRDIVMLAPGRMTDWKGQWLALDALLELSPEERSRLWLIFQGDHQGRTGYVEKLLDKVKSAGLTQVRFKPHLRDMAAAYLAADIVLTPSTRPEAFGRVAAEAAAMQRPVIASDHGGARETVVDGETGARFEPGNAKELAAAIRTLVSIGPSARLEMGLAGRQHVEAHYSKRTLQRATLQVYRELIGESPRTGTISTG